MVEKDLMGTVGDAGTAKKNVASARTHAVAAPLFAHELPKSIDGFALEEADQKMMEHLWPVGEDICDQVRRV